MRAVLLGLASCTVYLTSLRPPVTWDSIPTRLVPFSLLREGDLDLDEFGWLTRLEKKPYFLRHGRDGELVSRYPVANALLAMPAALPLLAWVERRQIPDDDVRFRLAALVAERVTAALVAAASVGLVAVAVFRMTTPGVALAVTLAYGFGSNAWATCSQALWQHGPAALALAGLSVLLLAPPTRWRVLAASGCAVLGVLARPTMIVFAAVALAYVWRERRAHLGPFLVLPVLGAAALLAYNLSLLGEVSGLYDESRLRLPALQRLSGLLISPNRGLLVFTPAAALAFARRPLGPGRGWLAHLRWGIAGYLVLYSCTVSWRGGATYGPRFLSDALPAFALCAVPAVEHFARAARGRAVLAALAAWGAAVQAVGAYGDPNVWYRADPMEQDSERVWSWTDWQILATARSGWHGTDLAPLLWQALRDDRSVLLRPLDSGDLTGTVAAAPPARLAAGGTTEISVRVVNRSAVPWPAFSDYGYLECRVTYRWLVGGEAVASAAGAAVLPRNLHPGESVSVQVSVTAPDQPGEYELELALVQVLDIERGRVGSARQRLPIGVE